VTKFFGCLRFDDGKVAEADTTKHAATSPSNGAITQLLSDNVFLKFINN